MMNVLRFLKDAIWKFFEDDVFTYAASVAFFTALSLAPLVVILVGVTGFFGDQLHDRLLDELDALLGPTATNTVDVVIRNAAERKMAGGISALIGLVTLFFSATAVFVQLQKSMNRIWGLESEPGREIREFLRKRLVSLSMILGVGFLLLVSLAISAVLSYILSGQGWLWQWVNLGASLFVYFLAFGAILQYVPDAEIRWRDVAVGALITAILFNVGKWAIGEYLGRSSVGSAYGAAGSLVVMLVWVYYSALVVFFGTELAVLYVERYGAGITPEGHARWSNPERRSKTDKGEKEKRKREEEREQSEGG